MTALLRLLLVFMIATAVPAVSVFAQTDRHDARLVLARSSSTAARPYESTIASASLDQVPVNLVAANLYAPVIEQLLRDSPTFRRQCARIAATPELLVTIEVDPPQPLQRPAALTTVARYEAGRIRAQVRIPPSPRTAELISHELEHVLEQLDGVDLRAKSRLKATGVYGCDCGANAVVYETARAISAGRRAVRELERNARR
jgi:hypothetical protein